MSTGWECLEDLRPDHRAAVIDKVKAFVRVHPGALLDHEPDWLAAQAVERDMSVRSFVCMNDAGEVIGYAPFLEHPSRLSIELGHYRAFGLRIRRLTLVRCPLLADCGPDATALVGGMLSRITVALGSRHVPFCLGLSLDTPFATALRSAAPTSGFFLMPRGGNTPRRLINLPARFEDYVAGLGAKTRQDLRRHERRLEKEAGVVNSTCYSKAEEAAQFLDLAEGISRKTYQWNLLNMGIKDTGEARRRLAVAAEHDWLRSYVLFCNREPVAFMLGYLHRGTYYSSQIGYDPRWSECSPGNVLHLHVVKDLIGRPPRALCFDFMYGDNSNKQRLSNCFRTECNLYIMPSTMKWRALSAITNGFNAVLELASRFLERHGFKARIRRYLRHKSTSGA